MTVVIAKLNTANGEARQTVINALAKVQEFSKPNEPGVLRHATLVSRDPSDDKSLYVIEEYADQAAFDGHMAAKATTDLISNFEANPSLFAKPTEISMSDISSSFVRPECARAADPFVGYASIDYKEGTRDEALEGWKGVTSATQNNEPDTLSYAIVKDKGNSVSVHTFEVYASERYFKEVHATSEAVANNRAKYGDSVRTAFNLRLLKLVGGFLHRDEKAGPNL
ncbi:hypothetical protein EJ04DRAFT_511689 [Polyplosphaeria fusca]|uniref:ABM domain-containing protein n=1 Tax=Polyplosphaeria fusca TaxID=682080 RepID=A0A9P4V3Q0_9PLEO|nr:hypothetical protein EJ04DRAFT_511689 [Polyplosphaeria fusca]